VLEVTNISFGYDQKEVLQQISFKAKKGEYIAIIGESGCGKSTLLEVIYGLLHIEKGSVFWNDEKLLGPNFYLVPGEPFMKYLPQDFDLMPFTTVAENVGKFLPNRFPKEKITRTTELLEVVDMTSFAEVKVKNLSGGQKQRVALAKVLAKEPELLLLDEPFSHIDNFRKNNLRRKLFSYLKEKNIGCLVATHDSTDALSFADKILVMKSGKILTEGTPEKLYRAPETKYIASFFGDVNEISCRDLGIKNAERETLLLYPNQLKIVKKSDIKIKIRSSFFKEGVYLIAAELNEQVVFVEHEKRLEKGAEFGIEISKKGLENNSF
jgi:ABC-type Fe3+/spermidine/putrescine transport system ATPase subunit